MSQTIDSADARQRAATYEDLLAVPEHLVAEILFGRLVTHPRPAPRHAVARSALGSVLGPPFQFGRGGPGGWIFMVEPELHLGAHVVVPDLAAWRRERLPALPETAWIEIAPDWVCEVLSPSTERYDRGDKRLIYAEAGVAPRLARRSRLCRCWRCSSCAKASGCCSMSFRDNARGELRSPLPS